MTTTTGVSRRTFSRCSRTFSTRRPSSRTLSRNTLYSPSRSRVFFSSLASPTRERRYEMKMSYSLLSVVPRSDRPAHSSSFSFRFSVETDSFDDARWRTDDFVKFKSFADSSPFLFLNVAKSPVPSCVPLGDFRRRVCSAPSAPADESFDAVSVSLGPPAMILVVLDTSVVVVSVAVSPSSEDPRIFFGFACVCLMWRSERGRETVRRIHG